MVLQFSGQLHNDGSSFIFMSSPSRCRNTEMRYRSTAGDEVEDMEVLLREVVRQLPGRRPMQCTHHADGARLTDHDGMDGHRAATMMACFASSTLH